MTGPTVPRPGDGSVPARSVAVGWVIAAACAAVVVLLLLLSSAIAGSALEAWLGLIAVTQLIWFAQVQFLETHRRRYGRWSSTLGLSRSGSAERREQLNALWRRDPVASVERSRLFGIGLLALAAVSGLAFLTAAIANR